MRRRLDLAVSLVATPPVLFLDEPTTGLDPRSRVELWEVLRGLVRDGTTLLLTTQYLEEADQLADRIVVVDHGKIIAEGTALELKDQSGRRASSSPSRGPRTFVAERMLRQHVSAVHVDESARQLTAPAEGLRDMTRVAAVFENSEIELDDLGLKRPSLDDVFLTRPATGPRTPPTSPSRSGPHDDRDHHRPPPAARVALSCARRGCCTSR